MMDARDISLLVANLLTDRYILRIIGPLDYYDPFSFCTILAKKRTDLISQRSLAKPSLSANLLQIECSLPSVIRNV